METDSIQMAFERRREEEETRSAWVVSWLKNNHSTELCSGAKAGSYLRLMDSCITQLKSQGPSRTCDESNKEEEEETRSAWVVSQSTIGLGRIVRVGGVCESVRMCVGVCGRVDPVGLGGVVVEVTILGVERRQERHLPSTRECPQNAERPPVPDTRVR